MPSSSASRSFPSASDVAAQARPALWCAATSAAAGLVVALLAVWLGGGAGSATDTLRAAGRVWLVALGSGLDLGSAQITLVPVGAMLLAVAVVQAATRWVLVDEPEDPALFVALMAVGHMVIAVAVSLVSSSAALSTSAPRAALGALVVGAAGGGIGLVRNHGVPESWWPADPPAVRVAVRAALSAVLVVLGVAVTIVTLLLVFRVERAGDLWASLAPGLGGGMALLGATLLAIPTLVLWCVAALLGPGFMLGTDTSVDLTGAHLGQVPAFPVLAALPPPGEFPGWVFVLALVPVAAGAVAGWRVVAGLPATDLLARVRVAAIAGALAGVMLGLPVGLSGGAIGPGRMADVGPPMLTPLLVAVPVLAVGAAIGAVLAHYRGPRATRVPTDGPTGRPRLRGRDQPPGSDRRDSRP